MSVAEDVKSELLKNKDLRGALFVNENEDEDKLVVSGYLQSDDVDKVLKSLKKDLKKKFPDTEIKYNVETSEFDGVTVSVSTKDDSSLESEPDDDGVVQIDQVKTIYQGELPISAIVSTQDHFKTLNRDIFRKVEAAISVFGFQAPIVLDQNLKVIDGNMRLDIAKERLRDKKTTKKTVPVIVLDTSEVKADFLRLALNRSGEFPRWLYKNIDPYIDDVPQLQPLLEPLGFFGEKILPTSFFGGTVINYELDPYNLQQQQYKQEQGLADWAEIQRKRIENEKTAKSKSIVKPATKDTKSLVDKVPSASDYLETVDVKEVTDVYVDQLKEKAEVITEKADEKTRKIKEERGEPWQNSRRTTKELAESRRKAAEKKAAKKRAEAEAAEKEVDDAYAEEAEVDSEEVENGEDS